MSAFGFRACSMPNLVCSTVTTILFSMLVQSRMFKHQQPPSSPSHRMGFLTTTTSRLSAQALREMRRRPSHSVKPGCSELRALKEDLQHCQPTPAKINSTDKEKTDRESAGLHDCSRTCSPDWVPKSALLARPSLLASAWEHHTEVCHSSSHQSVLC